MPVLWSSCCGVIYICLHVTLTRLARPVELLNTSVYILECVCHVSESTLRLRPSAVWGFPFSTLVTWLQTGCGLLHSWPLFRSLVTQSGMLRHSLSLSHTQLSRPNTHRLSVDCLTCPACRSACVDSLRRDSVRLYVCAHVIGCWMQQEKKFLLCMEGVASSELV